MINSPCKKICKIDPKSGLCTGCNRNINEIKNWLKFSNNQKEKLIQKLKLRKQRKITVTGS